MDKTQMPYERFERFGAKSLTNNDLLAIILRTGTKDKGIIDLCSEIVRLTGIDEYGMNALLSLNVNAIKSIKGIGKVKAAQIICIAEIARRIYTDTRIERLSFSDPGKVSRYYINRLKGYDREHVIVVYLDTKLRMISDEIITIGTVNSSLITPREVYVRALKNNAVSIMLLHNHPSGDVTPSNDDYSITKRLQSAGNMLMVPLVDHIIIGDGNYFSFKEHDIL